MPPVVRPAVLTGPAARTAEFIRPAPIHALERAAAEEDAFLFILRGSAQ